MTDRKDYPEKSGLPDPDGTADAQVPDAGATVNLGPSGASPDLEEAGALIGHYKLVRPLGEGGFGTVYLADQLEPVKRQVALKIIKLGMDTRNVIARFEAEKQALAMMDHPGIAKVFDAGSTGTGRPYFVMELVQGIPVTEYCDNHQMSTRQRLDLFCEICSAVQHAHQKGVIHRDLKPSNVLVAEVEGKPVPKVIDFGIAKATEARLTEKTFFTQEASFIGTPAYMSPEQTGLTGLDIDTRSDIYSLGVLLYEMLTGVTPYESEELLSAGFAEIQRIIREDDPPKPSTRAGSLGPRLDQTAENRRLGGSQLVKRLRGDLDWIVMKCLEKDRSRRYETANGLAGDVIRFLGDEPVTASPPSRVYRLKKLVARNRSVFAAGAAMLVLLAAGIVGTSIGLVRARSAETAAVAEAEKSTQIATFLADMLAGVGPSAARGRDTEMLEEILGETDARIGEELADQPEVQGVIRSHLGQTYFDLGRLEQAKSQYQEALELLVQAHGEQDVDVAKQYGNLGLVHEALQEFEPAETSFQKALKLRRALFAGKDNEDLAMNLVNLANLYVNLSRYEEAEPLLQEGLEQMQRIHGDQNEDVAIALNSMGNLMQHLKRYDEAGPYYEQALAAHKALLGDDHPYVITDISNLAWLAMNTGDLAGAARSFADMAALARRVYTEPHPNLILAIGSQGTAEMRQGHYETAAPLFKDAVALAEQLYGPDHPSTADELIRQGECLAAMGDTRQGDAVSLRALKIYNEAFGPDNPTTMRRTYNYAYSVYDRDDFAQAIPLLEKAVASYTAVMGREHRHTALVMDNLGRALRDAGRLDEAIPLFEEAKAIRVALMGPDHLLVGVMDLDLGLARHYQGQLDAAAVLMDSAQTIFTAQLDSTDRSHGSLEALMARLALDRGRTDEALRRLNRGRPISLAARGADHYEQVIYDALEGAVRARRGEIQPALALEARAESRLDQLKPRKRSLARLDCGRILTEGGRFTAAESMLLAAHRDLEATAGRGFYATGQAAAALADLYDRWAATGSAHAAEAARTWKTPPAVRSTDR